MIKSFQILPGLFFVGFILITACQPAALSPETRIETPALPAVLQPKTSGTPVGGAQPDTADSPMPALPPIDGESSLCEINPENLLISDCGNGSLVITRNDHSRRVDIFLNRDVVFDTDSVSIQAEVVSTPPEGQPLDENQYGIYLIDQTGAYRVVRIAGQYFNFETWSLEDDSIEIENRDNRVFSPHLKPAGQSNFLSLKCDETLCDLLVNGNLAGRTPEGSSGVSRAGIFTAADFDQNFGRVAFNGLDLSVLDPRKTEPQIFTQLDDLTADHNTFSDRGLSGAFSAYGSDGFHFSPIVPFNFYSARTGPSLADVSVEVTVTMDIEAGSKGSQFAGVVCRSNQEGTYIATLKVDGTFTLFRDHIRQQMAVLARGMSDAILLGREGNRLRLDCRGDLIDFYINGTQVASVRDTRYNMSFGRIGLFTKAGGAPNEDAIVFSDLSITELR